MFQWNPQVSLAPRIVMMTGLAIAVMGCSSAKNHRNDGSPWTLNERIEAGTPVERAMEMMALEGFSCEIVRDGRFVAQVKNNRGITTEEELSDIDYIRCLRADGGGFRDGFVTTVWSVALVLNETNEVDRIKMNRQLTGL